jgi:hypothetical protein
MSRVRVLLKILVLLVGGLVAAGCARSDQPSAGASGDTVTTPPSTGATCWASAAASPTCGCTDGRRATAPPWPPSSWSPSSSSHPSTTSSCTTQAATPSTQAAAATTSRRPWNPDPDRYITATQTADRRLHDRGQDPWADRRGRVGDGAGGAGLHGSLIDAEDRLRLRMGGLQPPGAGPPRRPGGAGGGDIGQAARGPDRGTGGCGGAQRGPPRRRSRLPSRTAWGAGR